MKQICLGQKHHKILKEEFANISRQTIYAALKYFNNSETAKAIRRRAKELLKEEFESITD